MTQLNVLVVEDSETEQLRFRTEVEIFESDHDLSIDIDFSDAAESAIQHLSSKRYDAVFLDLNLKGDSASHPPGSGEDVLKFIQESLHNQIVTFIVSSNLSSLSADFEDQIEPPLYRTFEREELESSLVELKKITLTGVTKVIGLDGQLNEMINKIYKSHLSPGFKEWLKFENVTETHILRYFANHILACLQVHDMDVNSENYVHLGPEFYIYPPVRSYLSSGDIFEFESKKMVVLSPACDMEPRRNGDNYIFNVERIVCAEIVPLTRADFTNRGLKKNSEGSVSEGTFNTFVKDMTSTRPRPRFHYLPSYLELPQAVIDFKSMHSLLRSNLEGTIAQASISSPFLKELQARFGAYYSRQGQPELSWARGDT